MSIFHRMNNKINDEKYQFKNKPNFTNKYNQFSNVDAGGINDILLR